jgi:hypothetical protein
MKPSSSAGHRPTGPLDTDGSRTDNSPVGGLSCPSGMTEANVVLSDLSELSLTPCILWLMVGHSACPDLSELVRVVVFQITPGQRALSGFRGRPEAVGRPGSGV